MNAKHLIFSFALAACLAAPAQGALDRIEETLELDRTQIELPGFATDQVVVRTCEDCERLILQVSEGTEYRLGLRGEKVDLQTFREAALKGQAEDTLIYVTFATNGQSVRRIALGTPPFAAAQ